MNAMYFGNVGELKSVRASENIRKFILDRYRIFLTRGMLGTFIFCEDPETGEYLETMIG